MWRLGHLWTQRETWLGGPITAEDHPTRVLRWGAAPLSLSNNSLSKRAHECLGVRSQVAPILYRKWQQGVFPPVDPGNGPLRGIVGIELRVLHKLGCKPRDLPRLSPHGVHIGSGNHTVQHEMVSKGVVVQQHNLSWARHALPPA